MVELAQLRLRNLAQLRSVSLSASAPVGGELLISPAIR